MFGEQKLGPQISIKHKENQGIKQGDIVLLVYIRQEKLQHIIEMKVIEWLNPWNKA